MPNRKSSNFACNRCRTGKRRCDGAKPRCTRCTRQNKPCNYDFEVKPRKKKYWDENYVHNLENQVKVLLQALEGASVHETESSSGSPVPATATKGVSLHDGDVDPGVSSATYPVALGRNAETSEDRSLTAMEELSVMMWRTNIGDGVTIINDSSSTDHATEPGYRVGGSGGGVGTTAAAPDERTEVVANAPHSVMQYVMHDKSLIKELADLFIANINSEHQFTTYTRGADVVASYPYESYDKAFLHSCILAVGATYSQRPGTAEMGEHFVQFAESLIFECFRRRPGIEVVQGLCILSWRSLASGRDHLGWIFISMAAGLCVHLRLHVLAVGECESRAWQPSRDDIRTFWMFFIIDRTAISILGRNCVLPWRRVNVPDFERALLMGPSADVAQVSFAWQCRLWHLHDGTMDQIFASTFSSLPTRQQVRLLVSSHEALQSFYNSHDHRLRLAGPATSRHALFFHLAYHMSLLITLPPFLHCFATTRRQQQQKQTSSATCPGSSSSSSSPSAGPTAATATTPSTDLLILVLRTLTNSASTMVRLVRLYSELDDSSPSSSSSSSSLFSGPNTNNANFRTAPNPVIIHHLLSAAIVHLMNATTAGSTSSTSSSSSQSHHPSHPHHSHSHQKLNPNPSPATATATHPPLCGGGTKGQLWIQSARHIRVCMDLLSELRRFWPERCDKSVRVIRVLAQRWGVLGALPVRWSARVDGGGGGLDGVDGLGDDDDDDDVEEEEEEEEDGEEDGDGEDDGDNAIPGVGHVRKEGQTQTGWHNNDPAAPALGVQDPTAANSWADWASMPPAYETEMMAPTDFWSLDMFPGHISGLDLPSLMEEQPPMGGFSAYSMH